MFWAVAIALCCSDFFVFCTVANSLFRAVANSLCSFGFGDVCELLHVWSVKVIKFSHQEASIELRGRSKTWSMLLCRVRLPVTDLLASWCIFIYVFDESLPRCPALKLCFIVYSGRSWKSHRKLKKLEGKHICFCHRRGHAQFLLSLHSNTSMGVGRTDKSISTCVNALKNHATYGVYTWTLQVRKKMMVFPGKVGSCWQVLA